MIIYTFGYQGFQPDELRQKAAELGAVVVDTRMSAYSRHAGWTRHNLMRVLDSYLYAGKEFGNVNYKKAGAAIEIADLKTGIERVRPFFVQNRPVILLCGCWSWATCHRTVIAKALQSEFGGEVKHLVRRDVPKTELKKKEENQTNFFF
jgi:uncharacterized protein (DUF488 family)